MTSSYDDVPYWLAGPVDEGPRLPWSGEALFDTTPPGAPDSQGFIDNITKIGSNLTNNAETIARVPADTVKGVVSVYNAVTGWFADPAQTPAAPTPPVAPAALSWVPAVDPFTEYSGNSPEPTWKDVYAWQQNTWHNLTPDVPVPQPIAGTQIQHAIDVASGQTIKALSGFINRNADLAVLAADVLAQQIADTQSVIGALNNNQGIVNGQVQAVLDPIVNTVLPLMQSEIGRLHDQILGTAEGAIKIAQQWGHDNIYVPLEEQLGQEKANRIAQVDGVIQGLPGEIVARAEPLIAPVVTGLAALAARVAVLEAENEDCTKPMCDSFGPKTDLGKFLKALNLALDAAFIADILTMHESDIADLLKKASSRAMGAVDNFTKYFEPGAETIGDIAKKIVADAI